MLLGYPGALPQARVERLMGDYFRHARGVARRLEWMRRVAPVPVGPNLVQSADGVRFIDAGGPPTRPDTWLSAFQAALEAGTAVSDDTLVCMHQHAERFSGDDFFLRPPIAPRGSHFLKPRAGLYARLSQMHDSGVLGRLLPEFAAITYRVVRDFYHKYTVDEHTLLAIRTLERLARLPPGTPSRASASASRRCCRISSAPSCWCSRCCCTTSASRATRTTSRRASAWPAASSSAWRCRPRRGSWSSS